MHGHSAAWLQISRSVASAMHNFTSPLWTFTFTFTDWLEILSSVNTVHNFKNPQLQILQMHGHFRFCHLIGSLAISSRCRAHLYKSYMHGRFYFCLLIRNITISSNCRAQFYKSYMHDHFYFFAWLEILPSVVTVLHNFTNLMCTVIFASVNSYIVSVLKYMLRTCHKSLPTWI